MSTTGNDGMKAPRYDYFRDGMELSDTGRFVMVWDLPKEVQEQFVEPRVVNKYVDDED